MIESKEMLYDYIEQDRKANKLPIPTLFWRLKRIVSPEYIWEYIVTLRKLEYHINCGSKLFQYYYFVKLQRLGVKLGFCIPPNVFGPGLSIPHFGMIVVNQNATVGKNCRLMHGVTIGSTSGSDKAAKIGDNVFLGSNSVILGDIEIADGVSVAANATVTKSCNINNAMLAGTPAQIKKENCEIWWEMNGLDL